MADEGVARKAVGNAFTIMVRVIDSWREVNYRVPGRGFRDNDGSNAGDVLAGFVAKFGDLFLAVGFGEFVKCNSGVLRS